MSVHSQDLDIHLYYHHFQQVEFDDLVMFLDTI